MAIVHTTWTYYRALWYYWVQGGSYAAFPFFPSCVRARIQIYQLALVPMMWSHPHYRSASLQQDLKDNLKNVALPGTGVPMSMFCVHWIVACIFIACGIPIICLYAALRDHGCNAGVHVLYEQYLLRPDDWFSLWQLNCRMASVHSLVTQAPGYAMENKWTFLQDGVAKGVAVSPFMTVRESEIACNNYMLLMLTVNMTCYNYYTEALF